MFDINKKHFCKCTRVGQKPIFQLQSQVANVLMWQSEYYNQIKYILTTLYCIKGGFSLYSYYYKPCPVTVYKYCECIITVKPVLRDCVFKRAKGTSLMSWLNHCWCSLWLHKLRCCYEDSKSTDADQSDQTWLIWGGWGLEKRHALIQSFSNAGCIQIYSKNVAC